MYDFLFGERDPVAEPGTATGTPGDWWTVFALVPDVLDHAVAGFRVYGARSDGSSTRSCASSADPRRLGTRQPVRVLAALQVVPVGRAHRGADRRRSPRTGTADCFSPLERAVLAYTDSSCCTAGGCADALFAALREHSATSRSSSSPTSTVLYEMHATMSRALRLEYDDRDDPIVEIAAPTGEVSRDIMGDISGAQPASGE